MLDKEEIRWLKNTCNELNNLLQRIYGHAFLSVERTASLPEVQQALGAIVDTVEKASHVTASMLDYVAACEEYINPRQPHPPSTPYSAPIKGDAPAAEPPAASAPKAFHEKAAAASGQTSPASSAPADAVPALSVPPAAVPPSSSSPPAPAPESEKKPSPAPEAKAPAAAPEPAPPAQTAQSADVETPSPAPAKAAKYSGLDFSGIPVANPDGPKELIMVVDDEAEVGRLIVAMLTEAGYRVIVAQDGFSAIQIYKKVGKAIDLVLLDFAMPIMDGEDVFDELRLINPNVAVILSSGFPQQAKLSALLAKGLRGFMPKPYTRDKLVAQVSQALSLGVRAKRSEA